MRFKENGTWTGKYERPLVPDQQNIKIAKENAPESLSSCFPSLKLSDEIRTQPRARKEESVQSSAWVVGVKIGIRKGTLCWAGCVRHYKG